jgi:hypothetical protein
MVSLPKQEITGTEFSPQAEKTAVRKKKKEVGIFQKGKKRNSEKSPSTKALTLLLLACFEDWEQFIKRGARNKRHYKRKKEKN